MVYLNDGLLVDGKMNFKFFSNGSIDKVIGEFRVSRRVIIALLITSVVAFLLWNFVVGIVRDMFFYKPEIGLLARAVSPDYRLEARIVRIIGGPPIGGAVVWQDVEIVTNGSPLKYINEKTNPGLVASVSKEDSMPIATLQWIGSGKLLICVDKNNQKLFDLDAHKMMVEGVCIKIVWTTK